MSPLCTPTGNPLVIALMKQQFVATHTIRQMETPALLNSWVTNTPYVKTFYPQKKIASPYIFVKT